MQQNDDADIVLACIEEKYVHKEVLMEEHAFVKILSGEMRVIQADNSYTFSPGDLILLPRNILSTLIKYPKDGRPYKSVLIFLRTERLQRYYSKNPFSKKPQQLSNIKIFKPHPLFDSLFASLMPYFELDSKLPESITAAKVDEAILILRHVTPEIDSMLADFEGPGKLNLADFMERNYMFNLTMDKFCYLTGRSLTTFKKDFKNKFGTSPQKWLTMKRLNLAHSEMKTKSRKANEVYIEVGFENLSHFSYAFKKQFGYSPNNIPE